MMNKTKRIENLEGAIANLSTIVASNARVSADSHNHFNERIASLQGSVSKLQSNYDKFNNKLEEIMAQLNFLFEKDNCDCVCQCNDNTVNIEYITQFLGMLVEYLDLDIEVIEPSHKLIQRKKKTATKTVKTKKNKKK